MKQFTQKISSFPVLANMLVAILLVAVIAIPRAAAGNNGYIANGTAISYTMHMGSTVWTVDTFLLDDSYMFEDMQSGMAIADPCASFHIGLVKDGSLAAGDSFNITGTGAGEYMRASMLVYGPGQETMEAVPFETGYACIETADSGNCVVRFYYSLHDKATGQLISLEGKAVFVANWLARH